MNSLGLRAVLQVTHPADGFWLLVGVAVAAVEHLCVSLLPAAILGVLVPFKGSNILLIFFFF